MRTYHRMEQRFGRWAIPGLLRYIAILQAVMWVLTLFRAEAVFDFLALDPARVLQGQVWRLLSFIVVPPTMNPIFILFAVFFLFFISNGLESAWGPFGVTLFFFSTVAGLVLAVFARYFVTGLPAPVAPDFVVLASLVMAFACLYPDLEIMLFGIIPLKMKWVGIMDAGFLGLLLLGGAWLEVPMALIPFCAVFVPRFFRHAGQRAQTVSRRAAYERKQLPRNDAFHTCSVCGVTDRDDPEMEFRVTDSGQELCLRCLRGRSEPPPLPPSS